MKNMKAKNKLGLVFFPAYDWAISPTHPEREERLLYTQDQLFEEGIEDIEGINFYNPGLALEKDIQRVHFMVPDVETRLTESHMIAVGGAIRAAKAVCDGEVDKAFALVRPPGHHAERMALGARGFCSVNTEAVMIEKMRAEHGPLKVAIIDTDAHHGDGTQDVYWNDPETLVISFHQDGRTLYPGTGFIDEFGGPGAYGYNINVPLPPETGDEGFMHVLDHVVLPILEDFQPDIIINSAGQDNHYTDPLTNMNLSAQGYAKLNEKLDPDIAVLEGGYSIEGALPYVNLGIILAMAGMDYSNVHEPDFHQTDLKQPADVTKYVEEISELVYHRWLNREDLAKKEFKNLEYVERARNVYYDTDGISDNQVQKFKVCSRCSGLNTIQSDADNGRRVFGITIPRDACWDCIKEGRELYDQTDRNYTNIYLQDNVKDEYYSK